MIKAIDSRGVMDREGAFALKTFSWKSLSPLSFLVISPGGGGALGYFLGGYVPPGTPNWHPVLRKISPKIDTPF